METQNSSGIVQGCDFGTLETHSHFGFNLHVKLPCSSNPLESYKCEGCNFETNFKLMLESHMSNGHKNPTSIFEEYHCEKCNFQTFSLLILAKHKDTCTQAGRNGAKSDRRPQIQTVLVEDSEQLTCKYCFNQFKEKRTLKSHVSRLHEIVWQQCEQCPYKGKTKRDLQRHVHRRHTREEDVKWFNCEQCAYKFKTTLELKRHLETNHTQKDGEMFFKNVTEYRNFPRLTLDQQLQVKLNGRPTPDLNIECISKSRGKNYVRKFQTNIYSKYRWICGCQEIHRLFCFSCTLFGGDSQWTTSGITDLVHLSEKAKQHENSKQHLTNEMRLTLLGKTNIQAQLDSAYWQNIVSHNENVTKNRFVLSKIIDAIKFCGAFELALRGHDETENSEKPGIFQGLINYAAEFDKTLKKHLETATAFKGTSEEIQNDLLDCIFEVYREEVSKEINIANFLGVIAVETSDVSAHLQTVLVLRYVKNGKPVERFWVFFTTTQQTAEALSSLILRELEPLVGKNPNKLIAQSYDGAAVMSGRQGGVQLQAKIKERYPLAHFVHCYAHNLNLIMAQAASQNTQVRLFFSNLSDIQAFFSNSNQRTGFLNKVVGRKRPTPARWDFKSRTVNVVYEYREELIECMEELEESLGINNTTKNQASAIRRMLQEKPFVFWLTFFHYVMPHVDTLFNEFQKRIIDTVEMNKCSKKFKESITNIRNQKMHEIMEKANAVEVTVSHKRKRKEENWNASAIEVCDVIIHVAEDRFQYTDQLNAANLFICEKFEWYELSFPQDYFIQTVKSYPMLEKRRLKTELSVLYSSSEYRNVSSCATLLNFLVDNNLQGVFQETIKLLEILVTMPMTTVEAERDLSTLKRIKTFLKSTMCQDKLNALACLSIEQKLIRSMFDFNEKVIDKFASKKNRHIDLIFKKV